MEGYATTRDESDSGNVEMMKFSKIGVTGVRFGSSSGPEDDLFEQVKRPWVAVLIADSVEQTGTAGLAKIRKLQNVVSIPTGSTTGGGFQDLEQRLPQVGGVTVENHIREAFGLLLRKIDRYAYTQIVFSLDKDGFFAGRKGRSGAQLTSLPVRKFITRLIYAHNALSMVSSDVIGAARPERCYRCGYFISGTGDTTRQIYPGIQCYGDHPEPADMRSSE